MSNNHIPSNPDAAGELLSRCSFAPKNISNDSSIVEVTVLRLFPRTQATLDMLLRDIVDAGEGCVTDEQINAEFLHRCDDLYRQAFEENGIDLTHGDIHITEVHPEILVLVQTSKDTSSAGTTKRAFPVPEETIV